MKLDTGIVITKGAAFVIAAVCLSLGTALAQWANSKEWPDPIVWVVILCNATGQGMNALIGFLSGAYADYVKGRANGSAMGNTSSDTALWKKAPDTAAPAGLSGVTVTKAVVILVFGLLLPLIIGHYSPTRSDSRRRAGQSNQADLTNKERQQHETNIPPYIAGDRIAADRVLIESRYDGNANN